MLNTDNFNALPPELQQRIAAIMSNQAVDAAQASNKEVTSKSTSTGKNRPSAIRFRQARYPNMPNKSQIDFASHFPPRHLGASRLTDQYPRQGLNKYIQACQTTPLNLSKFATKPRTGIGSVKTWLGRVVDLPPEGSILMWFLCLRLVRGLFGFFFDGFFFLWNTVSFVCEI